MLGDFPTDLPLDNCPACQEPIEYEKLGIGLIRFHTRTGEFLCPVDPKPNLDKTHKRTK